MHSWIVFPWVNRPQTTLKLNTRFSLCIKHFKTQSLEDGQELQLQAQPYRMLSSNAGLQLKNKLPAFLGTPDHAQLQIEVRHSRVVAHGLSKSLAGSRKVTTHIPDGSCNSR